MYYLGQQRITLHCVSRDSTARVQSVDDKAVFVFVTDANAHHSGWLESVSPTDRHGRDTYLLGVVSKQLRLLSGRVGDSTTLVNSLSPKMN